MRITAKINTEIDVKTTGMKFAIRTPDGKNHKGNLHLKKSRLIWCPGTTQPQNGHHIKWEDFIEWAEKISR